MISRGLDRGIERYGTVRNNLASDIRRLWDTLDRLKADPDQIIREANELLRKAQAAKDAAAVDQLKAIISQAQEDKYDEDR